MPDYLVDTWTVEDGLPLDHLTDLALSADGALWAASYDGLVRFDGVHFRVLRRATEPSLPSNRFTRLFAMPGGPLWAASEGGDLVHIDRGAALSVYRARADVAGAVFDLHMAGGALWASTDQGLLALGTRPSAVPDGPPGVALNSVGVDAEGTKWVGSEDAGVFLMRAGARPLRLIEPAGQARALRVLRVDEDGTAWVGGDALYLIRGERVTPITGIGGTLADVCEVARRPDAVHEVHDRHGWWRVEGEQAELVLPEEVPRCFATTGGAPNWPWRLTGKRVMRGSVTVFEASQPIIALLPGPADSVWVATAGDGLVRLRPRVVHAVPAPDAWKRRSVEAVLIDRVGGVWLGSIIEGLARVDPPWLVQFPGVHPDGRRPSVLGFVERPDGGLEVGTDLQLFRTPATSAQTSAVADPVAGAAPGWVAVHEPRRTRPSEVLVPLMRDRRGRTWLGGLASWVDGRDALFVHYEEAGVEAWREVRAPDGSAIRDARAATEGSDGAVFVATASEGLFRVRDDDVRQLGTSEGLSSQSIRSVYVDNQDAVWIGTEDAGLCRWLQASDRIACIGVADGLYDDVVHAILPDEFGRLWFSGNRGISFARVTTLAAVIERREASVLAVGLNVRDGMADREANGGLPQSAARDRAGHLWFATQDGAAWIDPSAVATPAPPPVELEALHVGGRSLTVPLGDSEPLQLESDAGALEVQWTAASLEHPDDLRFRYRLEGIDREWQPPSRERRATWLGLPAGKVVLEVEAGLGGAWGKRLRLEVERAPMFSETAWFPVSVAFATIALGFVTFFIWAWRQRRTRAHLEREIARRTVDLATANHELARRGAEVASQASRLNELNTLRQRFVADLSHELRTPLALVAGPLEDLAVGLGAALDADNLKRFTLIRGNLARLEVLSDELLDVARLEAGHLPMRARKRELAPFIAVIRDRFRTAFERKGLALEGRENTNISLYFDRELLDKVVTNLLANALKFTDAGRVTIALDVEDGGAANEGFARVSVSDTGIGIDAKDLPRIFERFYQVERGDARHYEGVGIGLALVRDLVVLHGGEVGVQSTRGAGSRFWFTLPLGAAHLGLHDIDLRQRDDAPARIDDPVEAAGAHTSDDDDQRPEVLVVEDHPDMRAFLAEHLGERFSIVQADGGAAALAQARARRPDAIVSDVMMPGIDGFELCRRLRDDASLRSIRSSWSRPRPATMTGSRGSRSPTTT